MNFKTTIALAFILILLLGLYFFVFRDSGQTDYQEKETISQAYGIKKNRVIKIRLEYKEESLQSFTLTRDEKEGWKFVESISASADNKKIDKLLKDLLDRKIKRRIIIKPDSLAKFGLEEPQIEYTVWTEDSSHKFLIGNKGISYSVYAKEAQEDSVFTIEHTGLEYFRKSPTDLREKSIFDFETDSVIRFTLKYPDSSIVCEFNSQDREWYMVEPIKAKADYNEVNKLLNKLKELQVEVFEKGEVEDFAPYGLKEPRIEVKVSTEDSQKVLQLGNKVPQTNRVYAKQKNSSSVYSISRDVLEELTKTVYQLRDKQVLDFQRIDVNKFVIERSDVKIVFERKSDDEWKIVEPFNAEADESSISDLLFRLDELQVQDFLGEQKNLEKYGLDSPSIKVTLYETEQSKPVTLLTGIQKDSMLYVSSVQSNQVYLVESKILEELKQKPSDFRDKRITDFYSGDVVELVLNYEGQSITCKKHGDNWRIAQPVNVDADDSKVNDMFYILNKIQAKKFVPQHPSVDNPRVSARVKLNDGTVYTLMIGDDADENSAYARVKEIEGTFTIDSSIVDKLKPSVDELIE